MTVKERFITGTCPAEELRPRAAELALTPGPLDREPYQPSTDLLLLTVPPNAAPDWAQAAAEIAAVVGPLWSAGRADAEAFEATLEPHQRRWVSQQRIDALAQLETAFGPDVLIHRDQL